MISSQRKGHSNLVAQPSREAPFRPRQQSVASRTRASRACARGRSLQVLATLAWLAIACTSAPDPTTSVAPDTLAAKIASVDRVNALDVVTWNVEWFGDTGNGPTNEELQLETVRAAIRGMKPDLLALQEVANVPQWERLKAGLPGYSGVLANDASVIGGAAAYGAGEQKPALLFRAQSLTLIGARVVLSAFDNAFAGRPPLELTLASTIGGSTQRVVVLVVHMKAFTDVDSYNRRVAASVALKEYLDTTYPTDRVLVLGDFNDDVDLSISSGRASPYANFVSDPERYSFPTATLSANRIPTTVGFPDAVDHQLATNEQAALLIASSVNIVRLDQSIARYADVTTDHYPVVASYRPR